MIWVAPETIKNTNPSLLRTTTQARYIVKWMQRSAYSWPQNCRSNVARFMSRVLCSRKKKPWLEDRLGNTTGGNEKNPCPKGIKAILKLTNTRQHNKYLLEYIGYMFRPVNRSSSGFQQNKSQVLFKYWDPCIFTVVNIQKKTWYWTKYIMSS